jgi:Trk K+ transport system NAD-binding subunit
MVAAYEEDSQTMYACQKAVMAGIPNIVALMQDPVLAHRLEKQGIHTVTPVKATHTLLYALIRYPDSFEVLYGAEEKDNIEVREFPPVPADYIGRKLKELHLPGNCLILMIMRDGKHIVPHGNTELEPGDALVLIGSRESLQELDAQLNLTGQPTELP